MASSDTADRILDAAETRIRSAGYHGFSFREIAADVGVKSASVHHHFPTKEALGAAVAKRYADRVLARIREDAATQGAPTAMANAFRHAIIEDRRMCLCGALGAEIAGLPAPVAQEAKRFFEQCLEVLQSGGLTDAEAARHIATLEGAMILARALGDQNAFDQAVSA